MTTAGKTTTTGYRSDDAETQYVAGRSASFAYRRFGPQTNVPLVLCMRFRGTIDHWDPALLQALSNEREVIVFDNAGVGYSSGTTPPSVAEMADGALEFIDALELSSLDLLGWSMGGFIAQTVALARPALVRRLVVAGSGPGRVPDMPATPDKVLAIMGKQNSDDEDVLYLFFPETADARAAGIASLRRLETRLAESQSAVSAQAGDAQLAAVTAFGTGVWDRLPDLEMPVLVANGAHDVMINSFASYAMSQRLPNAKVVLYSDAGHGFLFQHYAAFANEVLDFLDEEQP
jgi:pimeloyl-ACP methyl ester carboxylesterase